jgi:hypothetical protein
VDLAVARIVPEKKLAQELDEELEFHLSLRRQWTADRGRTGTGARQRCASAVPRSGANA